MPVPTERLPMSGRRFLLGTVNRRIGGHGGEITPDPFTFAVILDLLGGGQSVLHVSRQTFRIAAAGAGPGDRLMREGSIELGEGVSLTFRQVLLGVNTSRFGSAEDRIHS